MQDWAPDNVANVPDVTVIIANKTEIADTPYLKSVFDRPCLKLQCFDVKRKRNRGQSLLTSLKFFF